VVVSALGERDRTLFRRNHLGFVFQFFNLLPTLTVAENVLLPLELTGRSAGAAEKVAGLLDAVGLSDRGRAFPDRLSGGEQQRVAVARALAHDPSLVLADEPTGALDAETGRAVLAMLLELARGKGRTVVLVTHSPEVARAADRVLTLERGRLVAAGR
jgi:putative ABC transport system ATP-binding protein